MRDDAEMRMGRKHFNRLLLKTCRLMQIGLIARVA